VLVDDEVLSAGGGVEVGVDEVPSVTISVGCELVDDELFE
jgi:hypothetical protein